MKILVDSDFLVALSRSVDSNHKKALKLLEKIELEKPEVYISNLVKFESATVISHRDGMDAVRKFVLSVDSFCKNQIFVEEKVEEKIWKHFLAENKKKTSFIDCSNVVLVNEYKFDKILAFDEFYKDLRFK